MLRTIIKQLKSKTIKALPIVIFLMLLTSATNFYIVKNDIDNLRQFEEESELMTKEEQWQSISHTIEASQQVAIQNSKYLSAQTEQAILDSYPKLKVLEKEFETQRFSDKFYTILEDNLSMDGRTNPLFPSPYRTVVATRDGVISIFSNEKSEDEKVETQVLSWNDYFNISFNPEVSKHAINDVMERRAGSIFIQTSNIPGEKLTEVDMEVLKKLYMKHGIGVLSHFSILAPSYIRENSDIFGKSDNSFMQDNKSNKIIVIQSIKVSDILKVNERTIAISEKQQIAISSTISSYSDAIAISAMLWSLVLFILAVVLISIYNAERERCRHEDTTKIMLGGDSKSN